MWKYISTYVGAQPTIEIELLNATIAIQISPVLGGYPKPKSVGIRVYYVYVKWRLKLEMIEFGLGFPSWRGK